MKNQVVRILVAILLGSVLQEVLVLVTGKEVRSLFWVTAIIAYFLISGVLYIRGMLQMQREVDAKLKKNDDLIDD